MKFRISQPIAIQQMGSRTNQEDSIFPVLNAATAADRLFILCDGMGGHESGEIASSTVCKTISDYLLDKMTADEPLEDDMLEEAIAAAYTAVNAQDTAGQKKMGTTLTFLCFHKGGCTVAHIGDSRIYHLRPSTKEILYRSRDHSLVYDLFEVGEITYDEIKTAKNKNVITRVIMANQERPSKADIVHITNIQPGDYFYLCSDGMLEQMDDKALMEIFASDKTDDQKRSLLIGETVDNADNHTAYVIHIESVEHEEGDNLYPDNEAAARAANKVLMAELNPPVPPTLPPLPENQQPTVKQQHPVAEEYDDDVQVVVGQPVPPQPQYQAPPFTKKKNGGGLKFFLIGFFVIGILVAAAVAFFVINNNSKKEEVPTVTTTPHTETIEREDHDDDEEDRVETQSHQPQRRPTTTTTTPVRPRPNTNTTTTPPRGGNGGGKTGNGQQGGGSTGSSTGGSTGGGQQGGSQQGGGQQGGHQGGQQGGHQGGQQGGGSTGGEVFTPNL